MKYESTNVTVFTVVFFTKVFGKPLLAVVNMLTDFSGLLIIEPISLYCCDKMSAKMYAFLNSLLRGLNFNQRIRSATIKDTCVMYLGF